MPARKVASQTVKSVPTKRNPSKAAAPVKKQSARSQPAARNNQTRRPSNSLIGRVGNIGSEPEMRFTDSGLAVCNVSLAYTPYNFETKQQEETVWYRCIAFGQLAEQVVANITVGMRVVVCGRPQTDTWVDDNGDERTNKEILLQGIGPDITFNNVTSVKVGNKNSSNRRGDLQEYDDEEPF